MIKTKTEQLANNFFKEVDHIEFEELEKYVLGVLKQHGFYETACISVSDGGGIGVPAGTISRKAYYSPDLQAVVVIESSQSWDDYYDYETDTIEWRDYYYIRLYLYNHNKPFDDDDLHFLGDYEDNIIFYYSTNNFNDLYYDAE